MAITKQALTTALVRTFKGQGIEGSMSKKMARSIATGFVGWLPTIKVQSTHAGLAGAGTGTGKAILSPPQGTSFITQAISGLKLNGASAKPMGTAVAQGLSAIVNTSSVVQVTIAGSSTGTGTGVLTGISSSALSKKMSSSMRSNEIQGAQKNTLARSLSQGIAKFMKTASIQTVDVGTPVVPPAPGTGTGIGTIS